MLRHQVIAARHEGVTYAEIQTRYGVQPGMACDWWRRYQTEGDALFDRDGRGRPSGSGSGSGSGMRLDAKQGARIQRLIRDRIPDRLKLEFALWTRHAVQRLIEAEYGIVLRIRTAGLYLQRWGYTPRNARPSASTSNARRPSSAGWTKSTR